MTLQVILSQLSRIWLPASASLLWLVLFLFQHNAFAGEDRTYDSIGHEAIASLQQVLIDTGKCKNRNDCVVKQYIFFSSHSGGLSFGFYGVTEKSIVSQLVASLVLQAQKLPAGKKLEAEFLSDTKMTDVKRSVFTKAPVFAHISITGSYDPTK